MADRNKEIFDEVQAQIKMNAKKNAEHLAKMEQCMRNNRNFIGDMRALKLRNDAIWRQVNVDFDKCREEHRNPFLSLAKDYPKILADLSKWVEKSRKDARNEALAYGFDLQKIKHKEVKQKFFKGSADVVIEGSIGGKNKKCIRRVRI